LAILEFSRTINRTANTASPTLKFDLSISADVRRVSMLKSSLTSATCVALLLSAAFAQTAFAGPGGGGPSGDGFGVTQGSAGGLLSIVDPTREENPAQYVYTLFGGQNDTQVVGDWNGDGTKTIGVTQESNGALLWVRDFTGNGSLTYDLFGSAGDMPVVGDWDTTRPGDEMGFVREQGGSLVWYLEEDSVQGYTQQFFGGAGDTPAPGNWDSDAGNGDEPGVTQDLPGGLLWITQGSGTIDYAIFGGSGYVPVAGDYTGDGNTNFGAATPVTGTNLFVLDGDSIEYHVFGAMGDPPLSSRTYGQP
jgi:hypothetical protein